MGIPIPTVFFNGRKKAKMPTATGGSRHSRMQHNGPATVDTRGNPEVVDFRVPSQILLLTLNDRADWDVRSARLDTSGYSDTNGDVDSFPTAHTSARSLRPDDPYGDGLYRFWKIFRAEKCVAIADVDGLLHHRTAPPTDIFEKYEASERSTARLAIDVIGEAELPQS